MLHAPIADEWRVFELQQMALDLAKAGDATPLAAMLECGLSPGLLDASGHSLLMLAVCPGHLEVVKLLLMHGAAVDRGNVEGLSPLGGAAWKGFLDIARVLLAHGAQLNAADSGGATPLDGLGPEVWPS